LSGNSDALARKLARQKKGKEYSTGSAQVKRLAGGAILPAFLFLGIDKWD